MLYIESKSIDIRFKNETSAEEKEEFSNISLTSLIVNILVGLYLIIWFLYTFSNKKN